eukprot:TRINITY_DN9565_c0_g1_i3.p3 TRINITY_DN9565_c0_g1~~TRINITY_DN9565_c0_g1_i3.p3  ORF type:complete len:199 (-),score=35.02 TRINITY_DN9565_c0_g1_i3:9-605(-)
MFGGVIVIFIPSLAIDTYLLNNCLLYRIGALFTVISYGANLKTTNAGGCSVPLQTRPQTGLQICWLIFTASGAAGAIALAAFAHATDHEYTSAFVDYVVYFVAIGLSIFASIGQSVVVAIALSCVCWLDCGFLVSYLVGIASGALVNPACDFLTLGIAACVSFATGFLSLLLAYSVQVLVSPPKPDHPAVDQEMSTVP